MPLVLDYRDVPVVRGGAGGEGRAAGHGGRVGPSPGHSAEVMRGRRLWVMRCRLWNFDYGPTPGCDGGVVG
jgi:hypothetical protein